jgi:hypothetical protein
LVTVDISSTFALFPWGYLTLLNKQYTYASSNKQTTSSE